MISHQRFACPCCFFLTLLEEPPGTYAICPVCFWEDDLIQYRDPTYDCGANRVSLDLARVSYAKFGASALEYRGNVRPPLPNELSPGSTVQLPQSPRAEGG
jgi:hypothetical protein